VQRDGYGQTIITGARIDGWQWNCCQPKKSGKTKNGEMQFGVIYSDSAGQSDSIYCQLQTKRKSLVLCKTLLVLW
jgi:hypothetical protein